MTFYVVRHGQTNWNKQRRIQGKSDIKLNFTGLKQATVVKNLLENYDINLIVSSPLKRAAKTAQIINKRRKLPIIYSKALEERCCGEFEGVQVLEKNCLSAVDYQIIN